MDRSRSLWAIFLTLVVTFFVMEQGVSDVSVGQVATEEESFPPTAIVIDDTDNERFVIEGDGWAKNEFPVGYRGSVRMHTGTPESTQDTVAARWLFDALPAGSYDVYATWAWGKTLTQSITYTVTSNAQPLLSASVDQQKTPVGPRWSGSMYPWQKLGTVTLAENGIDLTVSIDGASTDTFSADAALLLPEGGTLAPSASVPSDTDETYGYVCDRGYCKAILGMDTPLAQCQASCLPEPVSSSAPAVSSAAPTASSTSSASIPSKSIGARWVTIGPPHISFTSCAQQCAIRGGTCMENACTPFRTIWDGQNWTGGQKLKANDTLLFHNACDAQWGNLAPTLQNDCCCEGVDTDPYCGDGIVQEALDEECDDGNRKPGDGCSPSCKREFCGDGIVSPKLGEECEPALPQTILGVSCGAQCTWEYCGDGIVQEALGEECDYGNRQIGDGCTQACKLP